MVALIARKSELKAVTCKEDKTVELNNTFINDYNARITVSPTILQIENSEYLK